MPEPENTPATETPDAPSATPAAPPAAPPEAPTPPPAATPPAPSAAAPVDPNQVFDIPDGKGGFVSSTLQEMADAKLAQVNAPADDEKTKQADLMAKIAAGDDGAREAAHTLVDQTFPTADPADPVDPKMAALETEVADLKKLVNDSHSPIVQQLRNAQEIGVYTNAIKKLAASAPYLAHNPEGPQMLQQTMRAMQAQAIASFGMTEESFRNHPNADRFLIESMANVENRLKSQAAVYKGFAPPAAGEVPATPQTTVVNDQGTTPGVIPAKIRFDSVTGQPIDADGNLLEQLPHGPLATIPAVPLAGQPVGAAPGSPETKLPEGSFSMDQLKASVRGSANAATEVGA